MKCQICKKEIGDNCSVCVDCAFASLLNNQMAAITKQAKEDTGDVANMFDYSRDKNGIIIEGYLGEDENVIIPHTIKGKPVYKIADYAFQFNECMVNVKLPDSLRIIGEGAFEDASCLETISIPEGVTFIGDSAFFKTSIKKFVIPKSLSYLGELALSESKIDSLIIPDNVKIVSRGLCEGCNSLKTVIIQGAERIDNGAFEDCSMLQNIYFPPTLKGIGELAFHGTALKKMIVPETVEMVGADNYPSKCHIAILGDKTQFEDSYGDYDAIIYCNESNKNAKRIANQGGMSRKPLTKFPKD